MGNIETVGVLGAGVIGSSWAALFLAAGYEVDVYEMADNAERRVNQFIESVWPTLLQLGLANRGNPSAIRFHRSSAQAVRRAQFIQESVPERIEAKHALFGEIESSLMPESIVASSASGLMIGEMQAGWKDPSRFLLGHPFNPPHLIPLVELMGNEHTGEGVLELAEQFYKDIGKVTIRVNKEVPAHVANRLQAALWREAISLVQNGVATVEDVDKAVWAGPGLRWAAMGPHMLFHLGAGSGGLEEFCHRYGKSFHRWWDDLDAVTLTEELATTLADGVKSESRGDDIESLMARRDAMIVSILKNRLPGRS